jgi:hypothetical protein
VAALTAVVHSVQNNSQADVVRLGIRLDATDADVSAVSASIVAVEERLRAAVTAGVSPLSAALAAQRRAVSTCTLQCHCYVLVHDTATVFYNVFERKRSVVLRSA